MNVANGPGDFVIAIGHQCNLDLRNTCQIQMDRQCQVVPFQFPLIVIRQDLTIHRDGQESGAGIALGISVHIFTNVKIEGTVLVLEIEAYDGGVAVTSAGITHVHEIGAPVIMTAHGKTVFLQLCVLQIVVGTLETAVGCQYSGLTGCIRGDEFYIPYAIPDTVIAVGNPLECQLPDTCYGNCYLSAMEVQS